MNAPSNVVIMQRTRVLVNVDGKRRVYNGCFAGWEWQWSSWRVLESMKFLKPDADPEARLQFWRGLNDYAVKERGKEAKCEFKLETIAAEEAS